jgi:hypothetical protein
VKPPGDLLEGFLNLAHATDAQIRSFAARWGTLEIFGSRVQSDEGQEFGIEYCDVWRYMAGVMSSVFAVAASAAPGRPEARWNQIGAAPTVIRDWHEMWGRKIAVTPSLAFLSVEEWMQPEAYWSVLVHFIGKGNRDRSMLVSILNTLLGLGRVRPWLRWPDDVERPNIVFSSARLMSYLSLQLCQNIGKLPPFAICDHCKRQYTPLKRAARATQRNFCPECREKGIPVVYANRAYRQRKRSKANG